MGRGVTVWMMGMALLALVGPAAARAAHDLSDAELRKAMAENHALASYMRRNGMPDVAESRFLADKPPWDKNEVALYYFDAHKEISFARAVILGEASIHLERFERRLSDAEIEKLRPRATSYGSGSQYASSSDPTARAEAAALRAEAAAGRVESAADAADRAADHAEAVASKSEHALHKSLKK